MKREQRRPLLHIENYSFDYESLNQPIINRILFSLDKNETTILMGASGSGKSSLALCLNGLYPDAVEGVSSGDIYYHGKNIRDFKKGELNQKIGIVFQDPESQFCMITVEDELAFTLENIKIPTSEMPKRISEGLKLVGMDGYQNRKIHELSGGQKQKIALASVLLLEPNILILDEPTANLDPVSSLEFIQLIKSVQEKHELAVLIIEHQADDWLDIVDKVLVMGKNGEIIANGNVNSIFIEKRSLIESEGVFLPKRFSNTADSFRNYVHSPLPLEEVILTVENMSFYRKKQTVLREINLEIQRGEFIAIIGENGAGKSTLIQLISGLLFPDKGNINFFDKPIDRWNDKELRKKMGYVFQNPEHQFITDTVSDELTFGLKLNGYSEKEIKSISTNLMKQFHLEKHRFSNPFSLSGGQKRRLSVATMMDETLDILFFDEPTFGQDAGTTRELMNMVGLLREKGTTIVFVTHDMDIVDITNRAIVLNEQTIVYNGEPRELWEQREILKKARLRLPYRIRSGCGEGAVYL
ncbi:ABC transporter ATP-binding protein [Oceanobacillus sp. Castelsardo]|uniref:ABC transporter ATP-binding protein n=1 Tax=Oceanobacillus sp. Castelsardo TaxID=1851204 RepID=UPI0008396DC9|nr:ABC transporter ATP-binding protein [Oceanobacillus sp. Castelsardo]